MKRAPKDYVSETGSTGYLSKEDYRGQMYWWAHWEDHAGRLVRRQVVAVAKTPREADALVLAAATVDAHIAAHQKVMKIRAEQTREQLQEIAQSACFPREVVAEIVRRLCAKITRAEDLDNSRPGVTGMQLFADRTGITTRELHRIVGDRERIKVSLEVVDRICGEFGMLFDDFIEESFAWAEMTGYWADRAGAPDTWPLLYVVTLKAYEGII